MSHLKIFCALLILVGPAMIFSQPIEFSNPEEILIPDSGPAAAYPSTIQVSGLPTYLDSLEVEVPTLFHDGSVDDLELLLVAPDGQQILLMSDVPINGVGVTLFNLRFDFEAQERIGPDNLSGPNMPYRPSNYGEEPDDFPAPGPGTISGTPGHLFALEGIDPNGEWQLKYKDLAAGCDREDWQCADPAGEGPPKQIKTAIP